jgi:N-acetylneuraminic acid mutarotase
VPASVPTPEETSTQGKYWTQSTTPLFVERSRAGVLNFENVMWLFGGRNDDGNLVFYNDVWRSLNGVDWVCVTDNAAFEPRSDFATTTFNGYIWLAGGYNMIENSEYPGSYNPQYLNDVYKTSNGIDWELVTSCAKFSKRRGHALVNYKNNLWLIGGYCFEYLDKFYSDVWKSSDGIDWTMVTGNANFQQRADFSCFVFKNEMWLIGGTNGSTYLKDIWKSSDGINWTLVNDNPMFSHRCLLQAFVHNNEIWVIGGKSHTGFSNDIWKSKDGVNWTKVISSADFSPRAGHNALSFKDKIFVLCGEDNSNYFNDIWFTE